MKLKLLFILFCLSHFLLAQEIEFGKITKAELLEEFYSKDKNASAAILYKKQETYFVYNIGNSYLTTEIFKRIKIYSNEGFKYATESINLYKAKNESEKVKKLKAYTYNIVDGKVEKTELSKSQVFENEYSYNYNQIKFTMPDVKVGTVIEFRYEIQSPFIWNMDELKFQYEIPVKKLYSEIRFPKGFNLKPTHKGFIPILVNKSTKIDHRAGVDVNIYEYKLDNIPALKEEVFVDNINNYSSGVLFELTSIDLPGYFKSFSKTWQDVAEVIGNSDDYKKQLDKTNSFDDSLDVVLKSKATQEEKIESVFKYVKDNIKWNELDGKYFFNGIKKALKEKKGNAADINLTLVAMLRYAGVDANPLVISTKDNLIPVFPTIDRMNFVIAYIRLNNKSYFLDATDEFSDINILPIRDYNWKGLLINNNKMQWNSIEVNKPKQAQHMANLTAEINEEGEVFGGLTSKYTNHEAYRFRKDFKQDVLDVYLKKRESNYGNIEISDYKVDNADTYKGHVLESFKFYSENMSEVQNDKIYFKPMGVFAHEFNPFNSKERVYPFDFKYPLKNTYRLNISIPEGYEVESLPKSIMMQLPDGIGESKYIIKKNSLGVQILFVFDLKEEYILPKYNTYLKEYFDQIIVKEKEPIILKRI